MAGGNDLESLSDLRDALANLEMDAALALVRARLDSDEDPVAILNECRDGMAIVSERYDKREYFLSELVFAGEIFKRTMHILEPKLQSCNAVRTLGSLMIGTVKGDIHGIGKNIVVAVARGAGFEVHDLGVDVPLETFVNRARELKPHIVGISVLLSTCFPATREVVQALKGAGLSPSPKTIVGGGAVTERVREYAGADAWADDAVKGINICKAFCGKGVDV